MKRDFRVLCDDAHRKKMIIMHTVTKHITLYMGSTYRVWAKMAAGSGNHRWTKGVMLIQMKLYQLWSSIPLIVFWVAARDFEQNEYCVVLKFSLPLFMAQPRNVTRWSKQSTQISHSECWPCTVYTLGPLHMYGTMWTYGGNGYSWSYQNLPLSYFLQLKSIFGTSKPRHLTVGFTTQRSSSQQS